MFSLLLGVVELPLQVSDVQALKLVDRIQRTRYAEKKAYIYIYIYIFMIGLPLDSGQRAGQDAAHKENNQCKKLKQQKSRSNKTPT